MLGPTRNDATAYSSNDVVNAINSAETTAGRINGSVIERNVRKRLAPRSYAASASDTSICSSRGTSTRIVYGSVITMCPITTAGAPFGTPSVWKSSNSAIPKTRYGITSGLSKSAETSGLPRNAPRTSASDESTPRMTAPTLVAAAIAALLCSASRRSPLTRNSWYQCSVNPLSGNVGTAELLNEKISRITIGA